MTRLTLEARGDAKVVVRRRFAAPPDAVFRVHTEPDLIRQWMTGPDGWTMTRCDHNRDGSFRYDWAEGSGNGFYLTGAFLDRDPPGRLLHVERMHLPDPTPDNRIETLFQPDGTGTLTIVTMTLPDAATRDAMLATGMEQGMEYSFARIDALVA